MLNNFKGLIQQMIEKPFKDEMLFSIYNFAEEEYYIHNLRQNGYDADFDDLSYLILDKNDMTNEDIRAFKHYIESEIQKDKVIIGILLYKGKSGIVPIAIKPKIVKAVDIFDNVE